VIPRFLKQKEGLSTEARGVRDLLTLSR